MGVPTRPPRWPRPRLDRSGRRAGGVRQRGDPKPASASALVTASSQRPGRRPGRSHTRGELLDAARALFAEKGYEGATIRAIAARAGVDAALVHHFFGTKEQVFVAAMELPVEPARLIPAVISSGPREEIGERMVRLFLTIWGSPASRAPFVAMIRSAMTHEEAARMIREFLSSALLDRVADSLQVPKLRITAVAAQMVGVVMLRYVLNVEPLASASDEEIVELIAPTLQRYLEPG